MLADIDDKTIKKAEYMLEIDVPLIVNNELEKQTIIKKKRSNNSILMEDIQEDLLAFSSVF